MDCKIFAVRVFVSDWDRAVAFYTQTLGLVPTFRNDGTGWMQLATGETQLAIERADPDDAEATALVGRFVGVSLAVDDIEAAHTDLVERGVSFQQPPERQSWGGILAHFADPDGNVLTLLGGLP